MISTSEVVPMMLAEVPQFSERWTRYQAAWGKESSGDYNDVAEFAHHLVDLYSRGKTDDVRAGLDLVEKLLVEGDDSVRQLMVIGVLEDLQNIASHRSFGYRVFEPWLGAQSSQAWAELQEIWKGKTHLAEVLAAEQGVKLKLRPWWKFWKRWERPVDVEKIENPELREIVEGLNRWEREPGPK